MKTIKQIAEEIGVSKTAVRKHMNDSFRTNFAETVSGVIYISKQGEAQLKSKLRKNEAQTENKPIRGNDSSNQVETVSEDSSIVSAMIAILQSELETKNKQIEELNLTIREQAASIRAQAESINTDRRNELAETIIDGTKLIENSNPPKKGFFRRFFGGESDG